MTRFAFGRRLAAGFAFLAFVAGAAAAEPAAVEGFRSARFDMTEEQLRAAIAADFKISPVQIVKQVHKADRTTILSIKVPDLLPESGVAQINYKLGYKSKKLIQVDVIFGAAVDPKVTPQALITCKSQGDSRCTCDLSIGRPAISSSGGASTSAKNRSNA